MPDKVVVLEVAVERHQMSSQAITHCTVDGIQAQITTKLLMHVCVLNEQQNYVYKYIPMNMSYR